MLYQLTCPTHRLSKLSALSFMTCVNIAQSAFKARPRDHAKRQAFLHILMFRGASPDHKRDPDLTQGANLQTHAWPMSQRISIKARHSRSTYLSTYTTFYMCIITYKKQSLPIDISLSFYYLIYVHHLV
jgi:hypothetical protein